MSASLSTLRHAQGVIRVKCRDDRALSSAVACSAAAQKAPQGYYNLEVMLRNVTRHGSETGVCGTCMDARGIGDSELTAAVHRSTLEELTNWLQWADRTLVF
jgi:uncharacterized protein involved in oxidation of intracellular sulfur